MRKESYQEDGVVVMEKHRDGAQAESTESELEPDGELDQQRAQEGREEGLRENHCQALGCVCVTATECE